MFQTCNVVLVVPLASRYYYNEGAHYDNSHAYTYLIVILYQMPHREIKAVNELWKADCKSNNIKIWTDIILIRH